ncbi:MAG: DegT/DnrJ/EryC1/StrS aminotransferase family protein [Magnetospirillum sp.]|nr:DegT/DnrJ/EryC1/StrS aminotransferase family protein [Magnetospirillum sp.]
MDFIDLKAQMAPLRNRIDARIARVLDHGGFIMGPEVAELEQRLSAFCGAAHTVTCANGTDALTLVLLAEGIGPGDAVFVPAFTFVASAEVVPLTGATPVFVDVLADSFNMDPASLDAAVGAARAAGLRPRMVVAVDLFGLPADYHALGRIAAAHAMIMVADAAQSFGAERSGKRVGTLADYTTTSFFPAKPLGCYGDGGAVFTDDGAKAELLRSLRVHGKGGDKYDNVRVGVNSRLDTIQAAILLEKLTVFPAEIEARQRVAETYGAAFSDMAALPVVPAASRSVWAQYTLRTPHRDAVIAACRAAGIPTGIYYPRPLNRQTGYADYPVAPGGVPVSERLATEVVSLPMHPYLSPAEQQQVVVTVRGALDPAKTG